MDRGAGSGGAAGERRRLENLAAAERMVRRCRRRHLVTNYLPGQVTYNLGEYPAEMPWTVGEEDERLLDEYAAAGISLVQLHEEWNDAERLFGADKFTPVNHEGLRRFIAMAHARGMRVLLYGSTGFFEERDPDYRQEWARDGTALVELWYRYARCSPASPSWRAYVMPRLLGLMDEWGADGIYDDCGYVREAWNLPATPDEVDAFSEGPDRDGALEDLLALLAAEIHRRGGILKVHLGGTDAPRSVLKLYDYLWIGEGIGDLDSQRKSARDLAPYVVPCFDFSEARPAGEDDLYLHTIPYLQFPLLVGGKPATGERVLVPGLPCLDPCEDHWTRHWLAINRHWRQHPEGPHSFGPWDATPGRPHAKERYVHWLHRYQQMVEQGTRAYLEISDSSLFHRPPGRDVAATLYANHELWLVLANYGHQPAEAITREPWVRCYGEDEPAESAGPSVDWIVPARSLLVVRRLHP
jgi:hypothetical protein